MSIVSSLPFIERQKPFISIRLSQNVHEASILLSGIILLHPGSYWLVGICDGSSQQLRPAAHIDIIPVGQLVLPAKLIATSMLHLLVYGELDSSVSYTECGW